MLRRRLRPISPIRFAILALVLGTGAGSPSGLHAQPGFPSIPVWAFAGAFQDSSLFAANRCVGAFRGYPADTLRETDRTITVRWKRDRLAEARVDFGGYRIYRVTNAPDTSQMVLIRRFSRQPGDERLWHFSAVDTVPTSPDYLQFKCRGAVVGDSIVTFVDPDSNGAFVKVCRRRDNIGRCLSVGDSIFVLMAPPGPHDGFRTWYTITYEAFNSADNNYEDLFVPDTLDNYARCDTIGKPNTCPNFNHKARNLIAAPIEPTAGPTTNLERVAVVPNPYRASESWERPGLSEVHFINLPPRARIKVFTIAGDLVAEIEHDDPLRDFHRWDLRNQNGRDISSGIYLYRVESESLSFQDRFVVIR
jgi:hypothetical protein